MFRVRTLLERSRLHRLIHILTPISLHIFPVHLPDLTLPIVRLKLHRRMRHRLRLRHALNFLWDAPMRIGDGHEEVRCSLSIGGLVPHVDEILTRLVGWTVIRHSPFVDNAYLVKDLV